ncbi:unnamed protein product [Effrenium voratum]|nr:unnamed protein product [Effrenium voratum]
MIEQVSVLEVDLECSVLIVHACAAHDTYLRFPRSCVFDRVCLWRRALCILLTSSEDLSLVGRVAAFMASCSRKALARSATSPALGQPVLEDMQLLILRPRPRVPPSIWQSSHG